MKPSGAAEKLYFLIIIFVKVSLQFQLLTMRKCGTVHFKVQGRVGGCCKKKEEKIKSLNANCGAPTSNILHCHCAPLRVKLEPVSPQVQKKHQDEK